MIWVHIGFAYEETWNRPPRPADWHHVGHDRLGWARSGFLADSILCVRVTDSVTKHMVLEVSEVPMYNELVLA